jgi:hypothetical protein
MFNKRITALYALFISSIVVASAFAIGFIQQQALAQGNQTGSGGIVTRPVAPLVVTELVVTQLVVAQQLVVVVSTTAQ